MSLGWSDLDTGYKMVPRQREVEGWYLLWIEFKKVKGLLKVNGRESHVPYGCL